MLKAKQGLLVMSEEHIDALPDMMRECGMDVRVATDCKTAREELRQFPDLDVVVADLSLADGNWWTLVRELVENDQSAEMIVRLPRPDMDDTMIRARGGFDVLRPPYRREQVQRLLNQACSAHQRQAEALRRRQGRRSS